ncbi:hypothetical protein PCASD_20915 [Puccinia coronata f. sp. avenae]|uniref:Uncharacterized protein n=1 Tax=Puccinia coronata f. sp. avenae TaxID=200324 RepID=A0A2N5TVV2_9BASI|nr:hypothetical protein PCASD_20915 [Puccinia coronata f. sp. avenae]
MVQIACYSYSNRLVPSVRLTAAVSSAKSLPKPSNICLYHSVHLQASLLTLAPPSLSPTGEASMDSGKKSSIFSAAFSPMCNPRAGRRVRPPVKLSTQSARPSAFGIPWSLKPDDTTSNSVEASTSASAIHKLDNQINTQRNNRLTYQNFKLETVLSVCLILLASAGKELITSPTIFDHVKVYSRCSVM